MRLTGERMHHQSDSGSSEELSCTAAEVSAPEARLAGKAGWSPDAGIGPWGALRYRPHVDSIDAIHGR